MMSADSLLTFRPSGGSAGIAATPCWPERQDNILMTKCAFGKEWPASGRSQDVQVEPLPHIKLEGAVGADVVQAATLRLEESRARRRRCFGPASCRLPGSPDRSYLSV